MKKTSLLASAFMAASIFTTQAEEQKPEELQLELGVLASDKVSALYLGAPITEYVAIIGGGFYSKEDSLRGGFLGAELKYDFTNEFTAAIDVYGAIGENSLGDVEEGVVATAIGKYELMDDLKAFASVDTEQQYSLGLEYDINEDLSVFAGALHDDDEHHTHLLLGFTWGFSKQGNATGLFGIGRALDKNNEKTYTPAPAPGPS